MSGTGPVLFVGVGKIGRPIAERLLAAGIVLHVIDDDAAAGAALATRGATVDRTADRLDHDRVILCLPDPPAVSELIARWLRHPIPTGAIIADLTTTTPARARSLAAQLAGAGGAYLDAPVSGGERGAKSGALVVTVGGERDAFDRMAPVLTHVGAPLHYCGASGSASLAKAINQYVYLAYNFAFAQGLSLGDALGLPHAIVLDMLTNGAPAHPLINDRLPIVAASDFHQGFPMKRCLKDLDCLELPQGFESEALALYDMMRRRLRQAVADGDGDLDILALARS
jgi:3-hydroxyisobutyrate dehydrogenase-like beta-hydroxyacid dehydrogenase